MPDSGFSYRRWTAASLALGIASLGSAADLATPVSFSKDIVPILQEKCQNCHRAGQIAPMSLVTYEETRPWAKAIKERVVTRNMPPWHLDKTVGIQHFQNDMSLSDDQIATIVRWVDGGAPRGDPKDMPPPKQWPQDDGWQLAKQLGREPDLVIESEPYTMPAKGQDVWFRPLTPIPLTEPRWVRAVEMRPATPAGRRITHHALALLQQEEPGSNAGAVSQGLLMEWAINKNYDIYRPNTGKLLVPGARIWWEMHYHAVGEEIRDHVQLAVYFYPKGQEPAYRTYLTAFPATPGNAGAGLSTFRRTRSPRPKAITALRAPARLENFQPHMHLRGKAMSMEAILPDGSQADAQLGGPLQLQLDDELHLRRRRGAGAAEGHDHSPGRLARQHGQQPEQSRSGSVGGMGRSHGGRNGARVGERHLYHR